MFSTMIKTNARKSTHSGKSRLGISIQGQYSQDGSSTSLERSTAGCPVPQSNDRSIWDAVISKPEPVKPDTSDDVILVSTTPPVNIRPLPKINFKRLSVGPKKKMVSDRNIFSALAPPRNISQKTFESRQHMPLHDGYTPQSIKASRSSSESVFKTPAVPKTATHTFVSDRRKPNLSNPSTWKSNPNNLPKRAAMSVRSSACTNHAGLNINRRPRSENIPLIDLDGIDSECLYDDLEQSSDKPVEFGHVFKKSTGKPKTFNRRQDHFKDLMDSDRDVWTSLTRYGSFDDNLTDVEDLHFNRSALDLEIRRLDDDFDMFDTKLGNAWSSGTRNFRDFVTNPSNSDRVRRKNMSFAKEKPSRISYCGNDSAFRQKPSTHRVISPEPNNRTSQKLSSGPPKSDCIKVTKNLVTHRNNTSLLSRSKPPQHRTHQTAKKHGAPAMRVIDLCKPAKSCVKQAKHTKNSHEVPRQHTNDDTKLSLSATSESSARRKSTHRGHQENVSQSNGLTAKKCSVFLQRNYLKHSFPAKNSASIGTLLQKDSVSGLTCKAPVSGRTQNKGLSSKAAITSSHTPGTKIKKGGDSASSPPIIPLNRLVVRLSPVKIKKTEKVEYDDIGGILFTSFDTQFDLESYLKTHPERLPSAAEESSTQSTRSDSHPGHHDTKLKTLSIKVKRPSDNMPSLQQTKSSLQKRLKQFERQLRTDLQRCSLQEIMHPRLIKRGISIKNDLMSHSVRSINLRAHGVRFKARSKRKYRLTEPKRKRKTPKVFVKSAVIKEHSATPTTGLKIRFTLSDKCAKDQESPGTSTSPEATTSTTSQKSQEVSLNPKASMSPEATTSTTSQESIRSSLVSKAANKLPEKESLPFKPFEQMVISTKSAFVSDALDKYLEDEEKHVTATVSVAGHPLLQTKVCDVTFKMPSKQSSYIKTLDMALKERQMARLKAKLPTVAETAEKLAKSLQHSTDTLKMSLAKLSAEKEKVSDACNDSDHKNTTNDQPALEDIEPKVSVDSMSEPQSPPKYRKIDLDEKKRHLEEKLENLNKKLKESDDFVKKSTGKSKNQTSWGTKLKIVNSRLVQQLSCQSPKQNAHKIKSKELDPSSFEQPVDQQVNTDQSKSDLGPDIDQKPIIDKKTGKVKSKRSAKSSTLKEFVRLDQQVVCDKEFCRLGCVCDSINLDLPVERLTKHCRKIECMFECVCHRNSIRILRNRKRPTIFQENSMLFYDGVGMFSNNNLSPSKETSGLVKNPQKPETSEINRVKSYSGTCARTVGYSPKCQIPPKKKKVDNSKVSDNTSQLQLSNTTPQSSTVSVCGKTDGANRATNTVPGVLYAPLRISLPGQSTSIVLFAPVQPSSLMMQKLQNGSLPGNQTKLQPASGIKNQLFLGGSAVPLAATTSTLTSNDKATPVTNSSTLISFRKTDACKKADTVNCKPSTSVSSSCQVNQSLESVGPNACKDSLLGGIIDHQKIPRNPTELLNRTKASQNVQSSSQCEKDKELSFTQLTSTTKTSLEENVALQAGDVNNHDCTPTEPCERRSKDVEDPSPKLPCTSVCSSPCTNNLEEHTCTHVKKNSDAQTTLSQKRSLGSTKDRVSAVVTRIKSPLRSSVSQSPGDIPAKADVKPSPGKAIKNLANKWDSSSRKVAPVIQPDSKAANKSRYTKFPASSNTKAKAKDVNNSKMTKTQVFLPGTSESDVNSEDPQEKSRSPLLIEIQSECNWTETKNEILSSISKHTSTSKGAPGVVRVGKYLVEILSKEENTNVTLLKSKSQVCEKAAPAVPVTSEKMTEVQATKDSLDKKASRPLSSSLPSLGHTTGKPLQGPKMPSKEIPKAKDVLIKTVMPNQSDTLGLNIVKTGTVATATIQGTAPLLAGLPPGSIMLSDGKTAAGYLVPLKAVQEQLRILAAPRNIAPHPSSLSNIVPPSGINQNTPSIPPANVPKLGPVCSGTGSNKVSSAVHPNSSEIVSMPNAVPTTQPSVSLSGSGKPLLSSAVITKASYGSLQLNDNLNTNQVPRQTTGFTDLRLPNCDDLSSQVIGSFPALDTERGKAEITPQVTASQSISSEQTSQDPSLAEDPEEFVDVETIDGIQPAQPSLKHKPRLKNPIPPVNSSTEVDISPSEVDCQVLSTIPQEGTDDYVDVETYDEKAATLLKELSLRAQSVRSVNSGLRSANSSPRSASSSQSKVASGSRRKRKSPVMQKIAFGEPEFIESYFPVAPDEEETNMEQPNLQTKELPIKSIHLIKERQRRRDQSDLFGGLKSIMLSKDSRVAKIAILAMAMREIKHLESETFKMEVQKTWLKQENYLRRSKLASLLDVNVLDYPTPFSDETGPNFLEYMKERGEVNYGLASAAQSETTSQDSESVDMDSSDEDIESPEIWSAHSKPVMNVDELVDVESLPQMESNYSSTLPFASRHLGLPKIVPQPSAGSRVVPKPQFSATAVKSRAGVSPKGPVPVALTALPFDFNMTPTSERLPLQDVLPQPSAKLLTIWSADSSDTVQSTEQVSKELYNGSLPPSVPVKCPNTLNSATSNDLDNADLGNANLGDMDPGNSDLENVDFGNADIGNAGLDNAAVSNSDVNNADLGSTVLNSTELNGVELDGAELDGAELSTAELNGVELNGAELKDAELNNAELNNSELNNSELNNSELNNSELNNSELNSAELNSAELNSAELNSAELDSAVSGIADLSTIPGNSNVNTTFPGIGNLHDTVISSEQEENTEVGESEYCIEMNTTTLDETAPRTSSELNVPAQTSSKELIQPTPAELVKENDVGPSFNNMSSVTPGENNVNNRSNVESLNSKDIRPDGIVEENGVFSVSSDNSDDEFINLSEDGSKTQHKSNARPVSERGDAPFSNKKTSPGHSTEKCLREQTTSPANLNIFSIITKGAVVSVTCADGEVIPLAVVKASSDGTMQVAVEGDISSEKVEELLSKPEVMDCLERVADTCDKSAS